MSDAEKSEPTGGTTDELPTLRRPDEGAAPSDEAPTNPSPAAAEPATQKKPAGKVILGGDAADDVTSPPAKRTEVVEPPGKRPAGKTEVVEPPGKRPAGKTEVAAPGPVAGSPVTRTLPSNDEPSPAPRRASPTVVGAPRDAARGDTAGGLVPWLLGGALLASALVGGGLWWLSRAAELEPEPPSGPRPGPSGSSSPDAAGSSGVAPTETAPTAPTTSEPPPPEASSADGAATAPRPGATGTSSAGPVPGLPSTWVLPSSLPTSFPTDLPPIPSGLIPSAIPIPTTLPGLPGQKPPEPAPPSPPPSSPSAKGS